MRQRYTDFSKGRPEIPEAATGKAARRKHGKLLLRLWQYMGKSRLLILLALLLSTLSSLLALYGPKLSGRAINAIATRSGVVDFDTVLRCAWMMAVCYILSAVFSWLLQLVMIRLSRRVARRMRSDIFTNLTSLPVGFFDRRQAGDIVSVITYDVDTVNQSLASDALQILQSTITVVVSLIMMLTIAPELMLVFAVTIPVTILFTRWLARRVRPLFRLRSKKLGTLNGFVEEMLSGQKTIRAYGREEEVQRRFEEKNADAVKTYTRAEANGTITGPSVTFINNTSLALVCIFGSLLFLKGVIRLGDLSSFVQYSRKFSGPINEVANIIADLQSAFAAAERVFGLIDAEPEPADRPDALTAGEVRGEVVIDKVNFSYEPAKPIITDFDLRAPQGSLIAIVGPTGAGKTTIINLLMRFYDVDSGEIRLDGVPIRNLTRSSLRKSYAMVLQDTWLFSGTVFDNIAYGKKDATMEDVVRAAKAARIHSYISRLPDGYNTVLTDNGSGISKGQKQLMTIARAMLLDANMLILDEATSNVDTRTEQEIQAAMRELMKGKTCFVIAHRLSTIRSADNILVMRGGRVVEQGTHDELMAKKSFYRELYRAQFDAEE